MGMYTEFHFNAELKTNCPEGVINMLKYMVGDIDNESEKPNHALFNNKTRFNYMLRSDSYYFDADTHSTMRYDEISVAYYLCIRTNLKNYNSEIELFIDWIKPYLNKDDDEFLGFYRYEETEEPTIIYY